MIFTYQLFIRLFQWGFYLFSFFNKKAKIALEGQKKTFSILKNQRDFDKKLVWFHAASLGEFEQGRPLIEKIKSQYPDYQILLTFFSPSGYAIRKNYASADIICYLPIDTKSKVAEFLALAKPDWVFFIKYEFWFNFLKALHHQGVKTYYIAAVFRPSQYFFKWYGRFLQKNLKNITHFFVQNESSKKQLQSIGIQQISVVGDPRIDRVAAIAENPSYYPIVANFLQGKKTLIAGSTWAQDEAILLPFFNQKTDWKLIIAPHEIDENHLQNIEKQTIRKIIRYSKATENTEADILLIDNIGMLSSLYQYGKLAYIGGGFGAGIHNTLEPMAHGLPVIFGKKYQKFEEATAMVAQGGMFCCQNAYEFKTIFEKLENDSFFQQAQMTVQRYISTQKGATAAIFEKVF